MITQQKIAEAYQPLFSLLHNEHGLTLLKSEMDEIMSAVETVNENLHEVWRVVCDVKGCDETAVNQGGHWKDSGYWCVCSKHSALGRNGKPRPKMKKEAIEREKSRNSEGYLTGNLC